MRGIGFSLAARNGQGWEVKYYLTLVDESYSGTGGWQRVEDKGFAWPMVGVIGPGPNYVMVPSIAPRGTYRLCTASETHKPQQDAAPDEACALLTIGT